MDFFELVGTGTPQSVQAAINQGADVNARDNYVEIPLMWAARFNQNPEVITTLLMAGADAKAKNKAGKTAFDNAQANEKLKGTDAYRKLEEASK
jgi:ankyrin repeat protein